MSRRSCAAILAAFLAVGSCVRVRPPSVVRSGATAPQLSRSAFLAAAAEEVAGLEADNLETGQSLLAAVRDNLSAYVALQGEDELELQALPQAQISYSLDDLLRLAAVSRDARKGANEERLEVEREQRVLVGATRRRDQAFKEYLDAAAGDAKVIAGLRLLQTRSAQAISTQRLRLLTQSRERASAYADATAERVVFASQNLATTPDDVR